jgi:hypothetical protein
MCSEAESGESVDCVMRVPEATFDALFKRAKDAEAEVEQLKAGLFEALQWNWLDDDADEERFNQLMAMAKKK